MLEVISDQATSTPQPFPSIPPVALSKFGLASIRVPIITGLPLRSVPSNLAVVKDTPSAIKLALYPETFIISFSVFFFILS